MSISIEETTSFEEGFCQSCETKINEKNQSINTLIFNIRLTKSNVSNYIRVCPECLKDLGDKINSIIKLGGVA